MRRHELLAALHERLRPRSYFEIGVRSGSSLTLSRSRSVAVDPFYRISEEIRCDVHLVRTTSDEFFARSHPFAHLRRPVVDLAFIDGMHLSEYALRDVINTERYTYPASVIVLDDMLPRTVVEAGRGRQEAAEHGAWAGDVYKVVDVLRRVRPDLVCLEVDTAPTGTAVLLLPDATDRSLGTAYDALVPELVVPDPQRVPGAVLHRSRAIDPQRLVDAPIWSVLRAARRLPAGLARQQVRRALAAAGLT
ncbi:MAG TPA: class I SAM-dependent methyltransferase [Nocardioidaceae bacterium]|nr:class I SAM-dependent methyltransferase [Nocardioidaceae bacterium]